MSILVICPKCEIGILIYESELNCRIFRCGVFKDTFIQLHPHLPKQECEKLVSENKIFGCGCAFEIDINNNAVECDYSK